MDGACTGARACSAGEEQRARHAQGDRGGPRACAMTQPAHGTPGMRVGSPRGSSVDGMGTPSCMGTPRTVATAKTSASAMTQLLDSERKLLLNQQRAEMARKDEELQRLRRALLYISEEATAETQLRADHAMLQEALARERESREQAERELERALVLLRDNVAQRVADKEATKEDLRLREERWTQQEQTRKTGVTEQLRSLEARNGQLEQELIAQKQRQHEEQQQHSAVEQEKSEEIARLQKACNDHQRSSNKCMEELLACRAKLEESDHALHTLRSQMEDISSKLQDSVVAYEHRRTKIVAQKAKIKELGARLEEEAEARQALSHELDTASSEMAKLRTQVDELSAHGAKHADEMAESEARHEHELRRMCASVEADRSQFQSLRALVEERHEEERAQRAAAEAALEEQVASLSQQLQQAHDSSASVEEQLNSCKDSLRKSTAQLCALGQRREQDSKQARLVEEALRQELDKVREAARERERLADERAERATRTASAREREAAELSQALTRLEEELRESREEASRLQALHQQEREQAEDERARLRALDAERDLARDKEEELKLRGLEQSFLAMLEDALLAALSPFSGEGREPSAPGDDCKAAHAAFTSLGETEFVAGGGQMSAARTWSTLHVTFGAPTPPPASAAAHFADAQKAPTPAGAPAFAAGRVLASTATSSPLPPPTPPMPASMRTGGRLIFADLTRVGEGAGGGRGGGAGGGEGDEEGGGDGGDYESGLAGGGGGADVTALHCR